MASIQPAQDKAQRADVTKSYGAQAEQWREIGIPAVAAGARYASAEATPAKSAGEPNKIVTLRDIDHLAA
ncbi:hypothetical protein [Aquabacter cavernae]|uniref:hypothetical protein n=1 Tax=Aquabacter cavernae TaxID=2496029 RepID=UPI000F8CCEC3|nr:hypothetical protein [Aquabacter cavernae]